MKVISARICSREPITWCGLLIGTFLSVTSLTAQVAGSGIELDYNYVVFGADQDFSTTDGTGIVEFSFSFPESSVRFGERGVGVLVISATFTDRETGETRFSIWPTTIEKSHGDSDSSIQQITALERVELPAGEYDVDLKVYNVGMEDQGDSTRTELVVPDFSDGTVVLSDIEFLENRRPADGERHRFRRGNDILYRNVRGLVVGPDFYLHAYVELYHPERLQQGRYHLYWVLIDSTGIPIFSIDSVYHAPDEDVVILAKSFNVSGVPTGRYYLLSRVYDGSRISATDSASSIRAFFVYNPPYDKMVRSISGEEKGEEIIDPMFAGLTEEELDLEYEKASWIIPGFKQDVYRGLSGAAPKARFLTQFWRALDDDPSTPENQFQDDYYERVKKASNFYRSNLTPKGWDSDRGRTLLRYGEPDNIERHPNDFNRKPFEIWSYSSLRYRFVFVDVSQTGNYIMVHGTAPGELRNENWEREYAQMHDDPNEESALDRAGRGAWE